MITSVQIFFSRFNGSSIWANYRKRMGDSSVWVRFI